MQTNHFLHKVTHLYTLPSRSNLCMCSMSPKMLALLFLVSHNDLATYWGKTAEQMEHSTTFVN